MITIKDYLFQEDNNEKSRIVNIVTNIGYIGFVCFVIEIIYNALK